MSRDMMGVQEVSPGYEFVAGNPAVPVGYKQTEVGVIPVGWGISSVGDEFTIQLGKMLDSERNTGEPKPYLGNRAVQWGRIDTTDLATVPMTKADLNKYRLDEGDILVCEGGEVGRAAIWNAQINECYFQKALHRLKPISGYNNKLMVAILCRWADKGILKNYVTQTSIAHLPRDKFLTIPIPVPPAEEQRAIATALSDVDALLEELDRLIAKKRDIKQAAMQQLLTGETRLPGFEGEWVTITLGEVIEKLDAGVSVNSTTDISIEGRPSVLKTSALENGTLDITETKVIVDKDLLRATLTPKKDTILISRMNTPNLVGETAYVGDDLNWIYLPDRIWMAQFKKNAGVCVKWMSYMLCSPSYRNALREMATGTSGSMKNISKPALLSLRMKFPRQSEQEAIANVISEIDTEIQALEKRRSKTAELKQGMMQELLTGRTRLV